MITEYMSYYEIQNEFQKEKSDVEAKILSYAKNKCKASRRLGAKFPATYDFTFTSKRNNRYFVVITFMNRSCAINTKMIVVYGVIVPKSDGRYEVVVSSKGTENVFGSMYDIIFKYNPHLFSRYAERMHKENLFGEELIREFFHKNVIICRCPDYIPTKEHPNSHMVTCAEGAMFGEYSEGNRVFVFKTFIANETMQRGYKSIHNSEYNEDVNMLYQYTTDKDVKAVMKYDRFLR